MATSPKKNTNGEDLSMEEILQSIKKIIADEDEDTETFEVSEEAAPEAPMELDNDVPRGSDVLELTDMVEIVDDVAVSNVDILQEIDDAVGESEPTAQKPTSAKAVVSDDEPQVASSKPAAAKKAKAQNAAEDSDVLPQSPRLLSDTAASASAAAFQKVIQTHKATTPMPQFRNNETIEDLVLETLKPLLKEWLDANLPPMVERIVEREIRKLVD